MISALDRLPRSRRLVSLAVAIGACAVLAGCGSSSSSSANATSSSATTSSVTAAGSGTNTNAGKLVAARVAAASCMRAQGLDIPDPGIGTASILNMLRVLATYPQAKVQAAETACAALIHQAFPNATSLTSAQREQRLQEGIAFSACMRSHGVNFPDPSTAANKLSGYIEALQSLNLQSPTLKAAAKTCTALTLHTGG